MKTVKYRKCKVCSKKVLWPSVEAFAIFYNNSKRMSGWYHKACYIRIGGKDTTARL